MDDGDLALAKPNDAISVLRGDLPCLFGLAPKNPQQQTTHMHVSRHLPAAHQQSRKACLVDNGDLTLAKPDNAISFLREDLPSLLVLATKHHGHATAQQLQLVLH